MSKNTLLPAADEEYDLEIKPGDGDITYSPELSGILEESSVETQLTDSGVLTEYSELLEHTGEETTVTEEFPLFSSEIAESPDYEKKNAFGDAVPLKKTKKAKVYYTGMFSAALSMVVMGVALIISLFTTAGINNALKISPIVLVFLGLELALNRYFAKGRRLRFDLRGYFVCAVMVALSAGLAALSVAVSNSDITRINLQERYEKELENLLIKDLSDLHNLKDVVVIFNSNEEDMGGYCGIDDIRDTDSLQAEFYFNETHKSLRDFSADCRSILDVLEDYNQPFGNISFIADDGLNSIKVTVNGKLEADISENELARLAFYFTGDFEEDLIDYEEE